MRTTKPESVGPVHERDEAARQEVLLPDFELESAAKRGAASFDEWVQCYFFSQPEFNDDSRIRQRYRVCMPGVYAALEKANGPLTKSMYCEAFVGATALSQRPPEGGRRGSGPEVRLHLVFNPSEAVLQDPGTLEATRLLYRCKQLSIKANQFLQKDDQAVCLDLIYTLVTDLLAYLESEVAAAKVPVASLKEKSGHPAASRLQLLPAWLDEFNRIVDFYSRSCRRQAEAVYLIGMLWGLGAIALISGLISLGLFFAGASASAFRLLVAFGAGAVGGMVSVMSRMTRGRLGINYETDQSALRNVGIFRPVVGAVFGLFIFAVAASALLPVRVPQAPLTQTFFYAAIAFLAGFSERFAQDVLARTSQGLVGGGSTTGRPGRQGGLGAPNGPARPGVAQSTGTEPDPEAEAM